jgi:hypothetical protein
LRLVFNFLGNLLLAAFAFDFLDLRRRHDNLLEKWGKETGRYWGLLLVSWIDAAGKLVERLLELGQLFCSQCVGHVIDLSGNGADRLVVG